MSEKHIPVSDAKISKYTKKEAIDRIWQLGKQNSLEDLTTKELRDEGRKY